MDTFNLRKFLKEGRLLKEYFDNDIENYINRSLSIVNWDEVSRRIEFGNKAKI